MDGFYLCNVERTAFGCFGVNGGQAGQPGGSWINPGTPDERHIVFSHEAIPVKAGDLLRLTTPGGGGWGDPLKRETELVRLDVSRRLVSVESARNDYGVVLAEVDDMTRVYEVDQAATADLRAEIAANRPPLKLINRGDHAERLIREGKIEVSDFDLPAFIDE